MPCGHSSASPAEQDINVKEAEEGCGISSQSPMTAHQHLANVNKAGLFFAQLAEQLIDIAKTEEHSSPCQQAQPVANIEG